jgi:hypothetical protein
VEPKSESRVEKEKESMTGVAAKAVEREGVAKTGGDKRVMVTDLRNNPVRVVIESEKPG